MRTPPDVAELADRMEIQELIARFVADLDRGRFDEAWARSIFTEDGGFRFTMGGHDGVAGMAEFVAAMMGKWARTHHVTAGHLVEVDGDRATVSGSLIATHLHPAGDAEPFQVGDRFEGEAVRTDAGWRVALLAFEVIWTRGTPPRRADTHDG